MNKGKSRSLVLGGMIAAQYVVLTLVSSVAGLASGAIQIRLSEALTVLPCFTSAAVPGLFVGCIIANILSGCALWDVVFGSLATLLGAVGTRLLRHNKLLAVFAPVISNTLVIPLVLMKVYSLETALPLLILSVGVGEIISCGVLGLLLHGVLKKRFRYLQD